MGLGEAMSLFFCNWDCYPIPYQPTMNAVQSIVVKLSTKRSRAMREGLTFPALRVANSWRYSGNWTMHRQGPLVECISICSRQHISSDVWWELEVGTKSSCSAVSGSTHHHELWATDLLMGKQRRRTSMHQLNCTSFIRNEFKTLHIFYILCKNISAVVTALGTHAWSSSSPSLRYWSHPLPKSQSAEDAVSGWASELQ